MKVNRTLMVLVSAVTAALASRAVATVTVDGSLDSDYGVAISSQTINTGFGDSNFSGTATGHGTDDTNGSELDAAYGTVENGTLYLLFTGDFQNNGNHFAVFIQSGSGGSNVLAASPPASPPNVTNMNGSTFSPNFAPTLAFDANDYGGTLYLDSYNLITDTHGYTGGSISLTNGVGSNQNDGGVAIALNNSNIGGVNGTTGTAADPVAVNAVTTGLEFGIPLAALGSPSGSIQVMALVNGGSDGYASNQFLPGLPVGTANVGGGTTPYTVTGKTGAFNFSSLPSEYFTVSVPTINVYTDAAGDNNWSNAGNWSVGIVPNYAGASATFSNASLNGTVNVDSSFTVGSINFSAGSYTLLANATSDVLTMNNGSNGDATIIDYAGTHIIAADLSLHSNTDVTIANDGDNLIVYSDISGPGALSSTNAGGGNGSALILLGNNTYTGGTIINNGELQVQSPTAFPNDSALTMNVLDQPNPTLDVYANSLTFSSLSGITGPNTAAVGAIGLIIDTQSAATITYAGTNANPSTFFGRLIDNTSNGGGALSLVVASGSLTINGYSTGQDGNGNAINNTPASFTGTTTINNGATLTLAAAAYGGALSQTSSITNNGTLNINDFESIGAITNNGSLNIGTGGTFQIRPGTGPLTLASAGLTLSGGHVDVVSSALILTYTTGHDPIATIRSAFAAGDVISSTAAITPGTSVGYADGNTDTGTAAAAGTILIRYTWLGDLNLDGAITTADFNTLQANIGNTNADWAHGDLNYDGTVNADDVSLFQLGVAEAGSNTLSVPEPASIALLALPLLGLRRRRAV